MTLRRWLGWAAAALVCIAPGVHASPALERQLDALLRVGEDRPAPALAAIDALPAPESPVEARWLTRARAEVAARSASAGEAQRWREAAVQAVRATEPAALVEAELQYLLALRAEHEDAGSMNELARAALAGYDGHCKALQPPRPDCEYRARWRLQQLLAQHARAQRAPAAARQHARAALELAIAGSDLWRQAWSESELALAAGHERDFSRAQAHLERALQLAAREEEPRLAARIALTEGTLAQDQGDWPRAHRSELRALALARQAQSPRYEAIALVNLSDQAVQSGRPAEALEHALQGLAAVKPLQIKRIERSLLNNAMLARVALGRRAEARADFEALQAAWSADGAIGRQVTSMREFGDALAKVGDLRGALELHHRETELSRRLMDANRTAALAELRSRYDREAQQRNIVLLERDNALKTTELDNRALSQRLWTLGAGVLVLTMVLMLLLVRRVRETNRALEHSRAKLRVQSERDPLTGLANRRHFQAVLQAGGEAAEGFRGALLMIDIDHFKHINDNHGHAAGDQVLVEVAQRIAAAVRSEADTVARWGGEEFLVLAPALQRHDTEALAQRLLQAVAGTPVALAGGGGLRATVSIGHAVFPLPPHRVKLTPEQAVNLADMALYTAKSQGRNRAVGIVQAEVADAQALRALEGDFERAWVEGRVQLRIDAGPGESAGRQSAGAAVVA
ncbi:diguanylate cyclase [Aquincola sp. S2]|uniref:diguanylate cyclase n=1 Tax=Pseudaquabacterium terrae TaxID=2732868 RepID=A0ABX2EKY9_9BURK|nr:diguanylate cyclase [Aquabacterium terrae]NRF69269.1 diguanylate cyclase [Aquabacterium terrae]